MTDFALYAGEQSTAPGAGSVHMREAATATDGSGNKLGQQVVQHADSSGTSIDPATHTDVAAVATALGTLGTLGSSPPALGGAATGILGVLRTLLDLAAVGGSGLKISGSISGSAVVTTTTQTRVTDVDTTDHSVLAANPDRLGLTITAEKGSPIAYFRWGGAASPTQYDFRLIADATTDDRWEMSGTIKTGALHVDWAASSGGVLMISEETP